MASVPPPSPAPALVGQRPGETPDEAMDRLVAEHKRSLLMAASSGASHSGPAVPRAASPRPAEGVATTASGSRTTGPIRTAPVGADAALSAAPGTPILEGAPGKRAQRSTSPTATTSRTATAPLTPPDGGDERMPPQSGLRSTRGGRPIRPARGLSVPTPGQATREEAEAPPRKRVPREPSPSLSSHSTPHTRGKSGAGARSNFGGRDCP